MKTIMKTNRKYYIITHYDKADNCICLMVIIETLLAFTRICSKLRFCPEKKQKESINPKIMKIKKKPAGKQHIILLYGNSDSNA